MHIVVLIDLSIEPTTVVVSKHFVKRQVVVTWSWSLHATCWPSSSEELYFGLS